VVHKTEAVIKKDERKNISEGLRFAIIEGQVEEGEGRERIPGFAQIIIK